MPGLAMDLLDDIDCTENKGICESGCGISMHYVQLVISRLWIYNMIVHWY